MSTFARVLCSGLFVAQVACSGERKAAPDGGVPVHLACGDASDACVLLPDAGPTAMAETPRRDAGIADGSAGADAAPRADAVEPDAMAPSVQARGPKADASTGSDAAVSFSYGPCPAKTHCDPLMAPIVAPLIAAYDPSAPLGVTACVPDAFVITAVPACYAPGPCQVSGNDGAVCLGMAPPHPKTGYCVLPCR